jgi:peptide/nickel transport system ATP-binding protein
MTVSIEQDPEILLRIEDLRTYFFVYDGTVKALDGVSLYVRRGETLGIVGETGCGKSVTAFSVMKLIQDPPGRIVSGQIIYKGANLTRYLPYEAKYIDRKNGRVKIKRNRRVIRLTERIFQGIRGREISMIFQEPTTALNPVLTVEKQVSEALLMHRKSEIINSILDKEKSDISGFKTEIRKLVEDFDIAGTQTDDFRKSAIQTISNFVKEPRQQIQIYDIVTSRGQKRRRRIRESLQVAKIGSLSEQAKHILELEKELDAQLKREGNEILAGSDIASLKKLASEIRFFKFKILLQKLNLVAKMASDKTIKVETSLWVEELLKQVSIQDAHKVLSSYPHELSGGMQQRVMISMALSCNPSLLIADEPTTALDVTIQAQILDLMKRLKKTTNASIMLITHDLGVISEVCDRVAVMYAGLVAETGTVTEIFKNPLHPYTKGLLSAIPRLDMPGKKLTSISGTVPNLLKPPSGCRFHPRCPYVMDVCKTNLPISIEVTKGHTVSCFLFGGDVNQ